MIRCLICEADIEEGRVKKLCPPCMRMIYEKVNKLIGAGFADWGLRSDDALQPEGAGRKDDSGKLRFELLPPDAIEQIVFILTKGAEKYASRNWEKGLSYGRVYGALQRHLSEFWKGNDVDKEWQAHHLAHAGCCVLFLLSYELRQMKEFDDRPQTTTVKGVEKLDMMNTEEPTL